MILLKQGLIQECNFSLLHTEYFTPDCGSVLAGDFQVNLEKTS